MAKKVVSEGVLVARANEVARRKCIKSLVAWSVRPISRESFPDDFADGFDFVDRSGSGAFEAFAGRLETNLASAPCAQCSKDCPGSHGECLLDVDPGALQDQEDLAVEEAEMSPFVLAAVRAGFDHDAALRMEAEMEIEMSRLSGEMDSIH